MRNTPAKRSLRGVFFMIDTRFDSDRRT